MKVIKLKQGSEEWLDFRKGKITGTRLHNIWSASEYLVGDLKEALVSNGIEIPKGSTKKILKELLNKEIESQLWIETWMKQPKKSGFYETIAERLAIDPDGEYPMARGLRLESEAADKFAKIYNKELEVVGCWQSDDDQRIINSPDRAVKPTKGNKIKEAVEIKCLNSASHIQAVVEDRIPDEYTSQVIQYFIVNDDLATLYFVFYDPRVRSVPLHCIEVTRESLGNKIERYKQFQILELKEMDKIVERLAF